MSKRQNITVRLFSHLHGQKACLTVVVRSVIAYVSPTIYTPMYSANFIDRLCTGVQLPWSSGTTFTIA